MAISLQLQRLERSHYTIDLFVPNAQEVQQDYLRQSQNQIPFPHWTRLWPAALAMADFLGDNQELIRNKQVLELAAGLALPGLIAARHAASVTISDYLEEAVACMARSAENTGLPNIRCRLIDWNDLPDDCSAVVLLLSDINYDPEQFDLLYRVLKRFLLAGAQIFLTTPQRLMAKSFIEKLLPFCVRQEERQIDHAGQRVPISLFILKLPVNGSVDLASG